jgi:hypothetical protein
MQLNERQRLILIGVCRDRKRLAAMPWNDRGISRQAVGRHRLRISQARDGMVPMALENWLERPPTNSDHVLCHRACVSLEGMGLILRCNPSGGRRTTHLKLTPAGLSLAEKLLAGQCAPEDIDD